MKAYIYITVSFLSLSSLMGADCEIGSFVLTPRSTNIQLPESSNACLPFIQKEIPIGQRLNRRNQHVLNLRCTAPFKPGKEVDYFETEDSFLQRELAFHMQKEKAIHERLEEREMNLTQKMAHVLTHMGMTMSAIKQNENNLNEISCSWQESEYRKDYLNTIILEDRYNKVFEFLRKKDRLLSEQRKELKKIEEQLCFVRDKLEKITPILEGKEKMIRERFCNSDEQPRKPIG